MVQILEFFYIITISLRHIQFDDILYTACSKIIIHIQLNEKTMISPKRKNKIRVSNTGRGGIKAIVSAENLPRSTYGSY